MASQFPSDHIQHLTRYFDKTLQNSTPIRLYMMCHGNVSVMVIGGVILTTSIVCTITSSPATHDLYYCTTWYLLLLTCTSYQVFWSHADPNIKTQLNALFVVMSKIEREAMENQRPQMHNTWRRVKCLQWFMYSSHFSIASVVSLRRIPDVKLPVGLRGLPFTNPWIIFLHVVQSVINPPALIGASHFFELIITIVLCVCDSFRVLSERLKVAHSDRDLYEVVNLHAQLLDCCGKLIDIFEKWLFLITSSLFFVSLGVTMSMTGGAIDMENMLLLPGQMNSILILCLFGDKLQQATECFADLAYSVPWYTGTAESKSLVSMMIRRAQKPLSLRCGVFGLLSLSAALSVFNTWYKFLNFLLKI